LLVVAEVLVVLVVQRPLPPMVVSVVEELAQALTEQRTQLSLAERLLLVLQTLVVEEEAVVLDVRNQVKMVVLV
jgi:hypothetical protein